MDVFDWVDVGTRVSPKRVAQVLVLGYVGLLCVHFDPAWDLFNSAVHQRVQQLTDTILTP